MIAISSQLDRPNPIFIGSTLSSALIFNLVDRGNDKTGWLLIPIMLFCVAAAPRAFRRTDPSDSPQAGRESEPMAEMSRFTELPVVLAIVVSLVGLSAVNWVFGMRLSVFNR